MYVLNPYQRVAAKILIGKMATKITLCERYGVILAAIFPGGILAATLYFAELRCHWDIIFILFMDQ